MVFPTLARRVAPELGARRQQARRAAYYHALMADEALRTELARLLETVRPLLLLPTGPDLEREIGAFATRWRLPRPWALADVRLTCVGASLGGPLTLRTASRSQPPTLPDGPIRPLAPAAFMYNPLTMSRSWLRRQAKQIAAEVEASILDQAEAIEAGIGCRATEPRDRNSEDLERLARRLYRRAVLEWGWERIAAQERDEDETRWCDGQTVRATIRAWAADLGVPLPNRPRGRPGSKNC